LDNERTVSVHILDVTPNLPIKVTRSQELHYNDKIARGQQKVTLYTKVQQLTILS
jgi:hypothetical protein